MRVTHIAGREVFNSRGLPALECEIILDSSIAVRAAVPSGASRGIYEAKPLYDGGQRLGGFGLTKAIGHIERTLGPEIVGREPDLVSIDARMRELDGTADKSCLGANTMLAVSSAVARAQATALDMHLYEFIAHICNFDSITVPYPMFNVINGGVHADNLLDIQEVLLVPLGFATYRQACEAAATVNYVLADVVREQGYRLFVGDEGGFAPDITDVREALECVMAAIIRAGYKIQEDFVLALDIAASQLFDQATHRYVVQGEERTTRELIDYYKELASEYPIFSIEDGLAEGDRTGWVSLAHECADDFQIAGDDLFASSPERIREGIKDRVASAAVIKPDQIGTVSEALESIMLCKKEGLNTIVSHRSGETEDVFIIDLAVGTSCGQFKAGGIMRGERTLKYNHLLRIEDNLHRSLLQA